MAVGKAECCQVIPEIDFGDLFPQSFNWIGTSREMLRSWAEPQGAGGTSSSRVHVVYLSVCLSAYLSVCLSVCLSDTKPSARGRAPTVLSCLLSMLQDLRSQGTTGGFCNSALKDIRASGRKYFSFPPAQFLCPMACPLPRSLTTP